MNRPADVGDVVAFTTVPDAVSWWEVIQVIGPLMKVRLIGGDLQLKVVARDNAKQIQPREGYTA